MEADDSFEDESVQPPAFKIEDVADDEFDLEIPPTSGNEYLRRVRQEASQCAQIVVANIDTSPFMGKQTVTIRQWAGKCHPAPKGFAPSEAWQREQVANFALIRQKLVRNKALRKRKCLITQADSKLPQMNDIEGWCRLCFGRLQPPSHSEREKDVNCTDNQNKHEGVLPLLSILTAMDQPTVIKVLEYHLNWFEATGFTQKQGCWFYALLANLDKPLMPDACALLRSLARSCASLRAALENPEDPRLVPLNLFICLISRYFDQSDLADGVS
ncbi:hypothetical protein CHS0354_031466 [Potamilus streckersoni]|uniref:Gem-associated protein 2 n=1 Tax=Potamilus streckersoni TaxID=2493646 RepID=A0AAE0VVX6_9BIVA|nr:hypothetical protein CHS0354_031466 [Potamilus streckersoni]